jgi:hypothetical protein
MKRPYKLTATLLLASVALPIGAWSFFKPIRVIAPELNGVTCAGAVCVEDLSTLSLAEELHETATANIAAKLRPLSSPPRAVFCSTRKCYQSFGGRGAGIAVFDLGVVIAPESWNVYIVEHELIHMLQAQELGLRGRERTPMWFKEGMPFYISDPPEADFPDYAKPWVEEYRAWEQRVGRENVWSEIRKYRRAANNSNQPTPASGRG